VQQDPNSRRNDRIAEDDPNAADCKFECQLHRRPFALEQRDCGADQCGVEEDDDEILHHVPAKQPRVERAVGVQRAVVVHCREDAIQGPERDETHRKGESREA